MPAPHRRLGRAAGRWVCAHHSTCTPTPHPPHHPHCFAIGSSSLVRLPAPCAFLADPPPPLLMRPPLHCTAGRLAWPGLFGFDVRPLLAGLLGPQLVAAAATPEAQAQASPAAHGVAGGAPGSVQAAVPDGGRGGAAGGATEVDAGGALCAAPPPPPHPSPPTHPPRPQPRGARTTEGTCRLWSRETRGPAGPDWVAG